MYEIILEKVTIRELMTLHSRREGRRLQSQARITRSEEISQAHHARPHPVHTQQHHFPPALSLLTAQIVPTPKSQAARQTNDTSKPKDPKSEKITMSMDGHRAVLCLHRAAPCRSGHAITVPRAGGTAQGTARGLSGWPEGTAGHRTKVVPDATAG